MDNYLKGKKWAVIGDSITDNGNKKASVRYYDLISKETGIIPTVMGISGSGYINGNGGTQQFYNRIDSIPEDTDIITIFGSVNDWSFPHGTALDKGTDTVGGCVNTTIEKIFKRCPTARLGIISALPAGSANEPFVPSNHNPDNRGREYAKLLKEICENHSIPFLDLYHQSLLRPWDEEFNKKFFGDADGCHPNDEGHKMFYRRIEMFIMSL